VLNHQNTSPKTLWIWSA